MWCSIHTIEVALERVEMCRPETAKLSKPSIDLHERLRSYPVETSLRINTCLDETRLPQHPQVFGNRGLRQSELLFDIPYRPLRGGEQTQDGAAGRLGNDGE
jgi:hypothetical protein